MKPAPITVKKIVLGLTMGSAVAASPAWSQLYPQRPIHIVTPEAGGGADIAARIIAQQMSPSLGQQVVIDNRGGELIAIETVAKAAPDGYTILFYGSNIWTLPYMREVPYDPVRDFMPITLAHRTPVMLVVNPTLPVESAKDLITLARKQPGKLNFGSTGSGSPTHLAAELFKSMAGIDIVRVQYKGTGPVLTALIGGQVELAFPTLASGITHVKSGRLRALGVTSAQRSEIAPDLPTISESGLPGYESVALQGLFAPAKTPAAIILRLNQEIVRALNAPEAKAKFLSAGIEVVGDTPEHFATIIRSEMQKWGRVIKDANIKAE